MLVILSFKRSYFWLIYIRRCSQCLKSFLFTHYYFFDSVGLLGLVTFSFSIYIFFGRNWWSQWDLFCLVLIHELCFLGGLLATTLPSRWFLCFLKLYGCYSLSWLDAFWFGGGCLLLVFASLKYFIEPCLAHLIPFT